MEKLTTVKLVLSTLHPQAEEEPIPAAEIARRISRGRYPDQDENILYVAEDFQNDLDEIERMRLHKECDMIVLVYHMKAPGARGAPSISIRRVPLKENDRDRMTREELQFKTSDQVWMTHSSTMPLGRVYAWDPCQPLVHVVHATGKHQKLCVLEEIPGGNCVPVFLPLETSLEVESLRETLQTATRQAIAPYGFPDDLVTRWLDCEITEVTLQNKVHRIVRSGLADEDFSEMCKYGQLGRSPEPAIRDAVERTREIVAENNATRKALRRHFHATSIFRVHKEYIAVRGIPSETHPHRAALHVDVLFQRAEDGSFHGDVYGLRNFCDYYWNVAGKPEKISTKPWTVPSRAFQMQRIDAVKPDDPRLLADQPIGVQTPLREHQRRTVAWMMNREAVPCGFFDDLHTTIHDPSSERFWYNPVSYGHNSELYADKEMMPGGGFVCDGMGMGKTLSTLALVCASMPPKETAEPLRERATLVVVPTVLVGQWKEEAARHLARDVLERVYVFQANAPTKRKRKCEDTAPTAEELRAYDLVIASYKDVQKNPSAIFTTGGWHRIVFDESHTEKEEAPNMPPLAAMRRWCLTATPWNENDVTLKSENRICRQLQLVGIREKTVSNRDAKSFLNQIAICHPTHIGQQILPYEEREVIVPFTETDRALYAREEDAVKETMRATYDLALIARKIDGLRRLASGGKLRREVYILPETAPNECSICLDVFQDPVSTQCAHFFCKACIEGHLQFSLPNCPMCRQQIDRRKFKLYTTEEAGVVPGGQCTRTKIDAVIAEMRRICEEEHNAHVLMFSDFDETLDLLRERWANPLRGVPLHVVKNRNGVASKIAALTAFHATEGASALAMTYRLGAHGLNLQTATHVFLINPPMKEMNLRQSIGRAHRSGQQRVVHVAHFRIENSVETRMAQWTGTIGTRAYFDHLVGVTPEAPVPE